MEQFIYVDGPHLVAHASHKHIQLLHNLGSVTRSGTIVITHTDNFLFEIALHYHIQDLDHELQLILGLMIYL